MEGEPRTFQRLFSEHFQCPPEEYQSKMFWRCLHRRTLPLSALLYWLNPAFFQKDFSAIRQLGVTTSQAEFQREVDDYAFTVRSYGNILQRRFCVRTSGRRLLSLARLFGKLPTPSGGPGSKAR